MNEIVQPIGARGARNRRGSGFTLIELLIVIAIIAILAGMILTANSAVSRSRIRARARAELGMLVMAIENYKTRMGHYPPDNQDPTTKQIRPDLNPLYFELLGTVRATNNGVIFFKTLNDTAQIFPNEFNTVFKDGVSGFINCSGRGGGDEASVARRFLVGDLKSPQIGNFINAPNAPDVKFLLCSVPAPYQDSNFVPPSGNRFRYVSSNPTNNPNSYDLWVDVVIGGKTNRICNWSKEPLIVSTP